MLTFRRNLVQVISATAFSLLFPLILLTPEQASASDETASRPNILLIMADDMGMGDTSAYQDVTGNSDEDQISTPAMERLARMGVRFTDAHTPSSRCTPTRYGLLTGRYPWRNRLKFWVLFGAQGDPLIERDRPTIASFLKQHGYRTGMVGKWHVGLRYRQTDGRPAAQFSDADFRQPLHDCPLDHGFEFARYTSRSHGTSGPQPGRRNRPDQSIGPGHLDGRTIVAATDDGRRLEGDGANAYVLQQLGGRHSDNALEFLQSHVSQPNRQQQPFFLYYASNSNHTPHTPDDSIAGRPVHGAARNVAGRPLGLRADYVYENDVALSRLLDWLQTTDDPRRPGRRLVSNTVVIFTSDNGAELDRNTATGPFRSHKGSCFEGGHRVPLIVSWPAGQVGDGNANTGGRTSDQLLGLTDLFATFAQILDERLPHVAAGRKGAEDSIGMLAAMKSELPGRPRPLFFNDHKQAADPAVLAFRLDHPECDGQSYPGQWKIFFDEQLVRYGFAHPVALYDLSSDLQEQNNRISDSTLQPLVRHLTEQATRHRTIGGHRLAELNAGSRIRFRWAQPKLLSAADPEVQQVVEANAQLVAGQSEFSVAADECRMTVRSGGSGTFNLNGRGLGIDGGRFGQVDDGEAVLLSFDCNVIVESVAVVAGNGVCGGFYSVGDHAPLAIYCIDGDIDSKDQSGRLSDIGLLKAGQILRLDSRAHLGVETPGRWRLADVTVRPLTRD